MTSSCPQNVTITNQDDIENGPLASCGDQLLFIQIEKAFGVLDFTNLISAEDINVHDSPQLEILSFPKLTILSSLVIDQATSLTELSMPMLSSTPPAFVSEDGNIVFGPLDLNITGAPVLTDLIMMNATDFGSLKLVNFGDGVDEFNQMSLADAQSAFSFEIASCLSLRDLRSVVDLHVIGGAGCSYPFSLSSVYDFTVTNSYATRVSLEAAMQVNNSLLVENSVYPVDHDSDFLQSYGTTVELGQITSVGSDATITSNANAHIDLSGLASIDAGLSVHNNTNCSFNFDQISRIGKSLEMMDNIETTLPLFSNLERAENIHLRGIINTTAGPNIFPALIYIPGTVTVEAWNDDFNCSKLVSQWHDRVINNLVCNGTDNGNTAGLAPNDGMDTSSNNGLSQGAWAGIGIGIGITVLGLATAIIWVMMHFKRRLNELAAARGGGEEVLLPVQYDTSTREPARSNTGISFFSEVEGSSPVHKYDKMEPPIYELSVMPVELPATTVSPKK
ncbi:hypothetical protein F5B22DRAFT_616543 [Xylaria bambusicola]|uniref:uncharacterized protein n=1 Tax=Xylaria bambusicola TaxID=326684 RepID=UPI0020089982|nr:uncharacterized protein F5B22DRAFT_616543 [Xylaria bambusicola]KAI0509499.1 hypothetical protein F5B22DRAFT_616543 [Xylaria bambusicola]